MTQPRGILALVDQNQTDTTAYILLLQLHGHSKAWQGAFILYLHLLFRLMIIQRPFVPSKADLSCSGLLGSGEHHGAPFFSGISAHKGKALRDSNSREVGHADLASNAIEALGSSPNKTTDRLISCSSDLETNRCFLSLSRVPRNIKAIEKPESAGRVQLSQARLYHEHDIEDFHPN
jgi:hypothetical protein